MERNRRGCWGGEGLAGETPVEDPVRVLLCLFLRPALMLLFFSVYPWWVQRLVWPAFVTLRSSPVTDGGISLQCGAVLKLMAMSLVFPTAAETDCISSPTQLPSLEVQQKQFVPLRFWFPWKIWSNKIPCILFTLINNKVSKHLWSCLGKNWIALWYILGENFTIFPFFPDSGLEI